MFISSKMVRQVHKVTNRNLGEICSTSFSSFSAQIALLIAYLLWFPFDVHFNCNFLHNCLHSAHYRVFVHQLSVLVYISSLLVSPLFFRSVQGLARLTLQSRDQDQIFNNYGLSIETETRLTSGLETETFRTTHLQGPEFSSICSLR